MDAFVYDETDAPLLGQLNGVWVESEDVEPPVLITPPSWRSWLLDLLVCWWPHQRKWVIQSL